jgi:hypothetical protein
MTRNVKGASQSKSANEILSLIMRMKISLSLALCATLSLCGCATRVTAPSPEFQQIILKEAQTRRFTSALLGTVTVPAGTYTPDFEANNGVYYRAPGHLIRDSVLVMRGGIFIPKDHFHPRNQGIWFDHQEESSGLLRFAATSPTRVYDVDEAFDFEILRKER